MEQTNEPNLSTSFKQTNEPNFSTSSRKSGLQSFSDSESQSRDSFLYFCASLVIIICLIVLACCVLLIFAFKVSGVGATTGPPDDDKATLAKETRGVITIPAPLSFSTTPPGPHTPATHSSPPLEMTKYSQSSTLFTASPAYSNTSTTSSTIATTTPTTASTLPETPWEEPTPAPTFAVAEPVNPGTLLCTVSDQVGAQASAIPPDGLCDLLFFDSFFSDGKNDLTEGYRSLEPGARYFIQQASPAFKTALGVSFAPSTPGSMTPYRSWKFYNEIDNLWAKNIYHFGFVNLYREFSGNDTVADALIMLRALHAHIDRRNVYRRPSYMVLGVSIESRNKSDVLKLMSTIFVPSLFVAIGHISYTDASLSNCRILPPTVWTLPKGIDRQDLSYGHTLFEAVTLLEEVNALRLYMPLALSLSLAGRYYEPNFTDPVSPVDEEFALFKPCQDFNTSRYGDPVSVVCESADTDWKFENITKHNYAYAFSKSERRTLTYDTKDTLTKKVCDAKYHFVEMRYNLAAYDTDYDASAAGCTNFGLSDGAFNRLALIRILQDYLQTEYTSSNKIFACRTSASPGRTS